MIQCDFCTNWFHIDCLKFNKSSLNKIKKFKCPCCSLISNSHYNKSLEVHNLERTPLDEYMVLLSEVKSLSEYIKLGPNQIDVLMYYERYQAILQKAAPLAKELDSFIESEQKPGVTGDVVRSKALPCINQLKVYLTHLLGMPFSCPLTTLVTKVLRKFSLLDRIYQMKDKKRVEQDDLHFIDSMRTDQQLRSDFLLKNVAHCEEVLNHLAKIEVLDRRRLPYADYKKQFEKLIKIIKYTNLLERSLKVVEDWPTIQKAIDNKITNPRLLTLKVYKDDLAMLERLPFSNEYENTFRDRIRILDLWKAEVKRLQNSKTSPDLAIVKSLVDRVKDLITPSEPDLIWLQTILQTVDLN